MSITVQGTRHELDSVQGQLPGWISECGKKFPLDRRFEVVYADPPWRYRGNTGTRGLPPYPQMSLEDLKQLPVSRIAAPTSVLLMWATSPLLQDAMDLMRAWGYCYKTVFKVWGKRSTHGKPVCGFGQYTRSSVELLLIGTRGSGATKWLTSRSEPQEFAGLRGAHSAKPLEIRDSIKRLFDVPNRIELFARTTSPGWSAWGLETPGYFHAAQQ